MKKISHSETISVIVSLLLILLMAFGLTATAFSQTVSEYSSVAMVTHKQPDGVRMHDGKVWLTKSGNTVILEKEIVVSGGTHIKPDGSVVTKSGYTATLHEGDFINSSGKLISSDSKATATNDNDDEDEDDN